jgi:hypothetical protein
MRTLAIKPMCEAAFTSFAASGRIYQLLMEPLQAARHAK